MWLDDDQDKVVAYLDYRRRLCPDCGTAEEDWIDPVTRRLKDEPTWEATTEQCFGCVTLARELETVPGREKGVRAFLIPWREDDV
jgi:hypothetical protein